MNGMLDALLVGSVLCAAFAYAIYSLGPRSLRIRGLTGVTALIRRLPNLKLRSVAVRIAAAAGKTGGACGGCDNCGSKDAAGAPDSAPEVKISLSHIGRRR